MSLEDSFKIVTTILLGVLGYIGSRVFSATVNNTLAINRLSVEMEQLRKSTDRISKIETDVLALAQNKSQKRPHHYKGE